MQQKGRQLVPTTNIAKDWEPLPVHFIHDDEDLKMDPVKLGHILCTECGSSFVNSALGDGPSGYPPRCPLPGLSIVAVAALSNVAVAALSIVAVAALSNDHTCNVSCVRPHYGTRERQLFSRLDKRSNAHIAFAMHAQIGHLFASACTRAEKVGRAQECIQPSGGGAAQHMGPRGPEIERGLTETSRPPKLALG